MSTPGWVLRLTWCGADAGGQGVAQDMLVAVVEGEGSGHAEPLPGGQARVRAAGEGDVLAQAVGQGLVGRPRGQDVLPLCRGCHDCQTARKKTPDGGEGASASMSVMLGSTVGMGCVWTRRDGLSTGSYLSWSSGRAPCRE